MNITLLLGTGLLLIGIVLAGFGIATVGLESQSLIETAGAHRSRWLICCGAWRCQPRPDSRWRLARFSSG